MKIPEILNMDVLGHSPKGETEAFEPNYVPNDIGKDYDLTVNIFGYELDYDAVSILIHELDIFRNNVVIDQRRKVKKLREARKEK